MMRTAFTPACLALAAFACGSLLGCSGDEDSGCDQNIAGNVCTIAGSTENGYAGDDGPALEALLSLPQDTLTASDGTVYLLDWNNHRIRKIENGVIRHVAGRGELGGTLDDPANSDFNHPTGMLFTPGEDRMVVSAWHNSKIRTLDLATNEIVDTCGDGRRAYFGDNGPALSASLDLPSSIAWDAQRNLVIMDQANQVIRVIDGAQNIQTLYGRCVIDAAAPSGPGACEAATA
jgi:DNA-binding beta-propeller fold protein YncE